MRKLPLREPKGFFRSWEEEQSLLYCWPSNRRNSARECCCLSTMENRGIAESEIDLKSELNEMHQEMQTNGLESKLNSTNCCNYSYLLHLCPFKTYHMWFYIAYYPCISILQTRLSSAGSLEGWSISKHLGPQASCIYIVHILFISSVDLCLWESP